MDRITAGLLAIFDGERGAFFLVMLIALMIGGGILLVVNLTARPRPPPQPVWEPVPDEVAAPARHATPASPSRPVGPAPRRKA